MNEWIQILQPCIPNNFTAKQETAINRWITSLNQGYSGYWLVLIHIFLIYFLGCNPGSEGRWEANASVFCSKLRRIKRSETIDGTGSWCHHSGYFAEIHHSRSSWGFKVHGIFTGGEGCYSNHKWLTYAYRGPFKFIKRKLVRKTPLEALFWQVCWVRTGCSLWSIIYQFICLLVSLYRAPQLPPLSLKRMRLVFQPFTTPLNEETLRYFRNYYPQCFKNNKTVRISTPKCRQWTFSRDVLKKEKQDFLCKFCTMTP